MSVRSCECLHLGVAYADENQLTLELLEHALDGAGAAAAGHGDVELVVVLGHFGDWWVVRLCRGSCGGRGGQETAGVMVDVDVQAKWLLGN